MRSGRDQDQFIFKKWLGLDLAASCRPLDESQRDLLLLHGLHNVFGVAADQGWVNARMLPPKLSQEPRQHILCNGGGRAQRQLSGMFSAQGGNLVLGLGEKRLDLFAILRRILPAAVSVMCAPVRSKS